MGIKMDFLDDKFERIDADTTDPKFFWDEFHRITEILDSDLSAIKRIIDLDDSQFWRKVYFRTFFSYLDALYILYVNYSCSLIGLLFLKNRT